MAFDTQRAARRLTDAGLDERAAQGVADVVDRATSGLATEASVLAVKGRPALVQGRTQGRPALVQVRVQGRAALVQVRVQGRAVLVQVRVQGRAARVQVRVQGKSCSRPGPISRKTCTLSGLRCTARSGSRAPASSPPPPPSSASPPLSANPPTQRSALTRALCLQGERGPDRPRKLGAPSRPPGGGVRLHLAALARGAPLTPALSRKGRGGRTGLGPCGRAADPAAAQPGAPGGGVGAPSRRAGARRTPHPRPNPQGARGLDRPRELGARSDPAAAQPGAPGGGVGARPPHRRKSEGGWVGRAALRGIPRVYDTTVRTLLRDGVWGRSPHRRDPLAL